MQVSGLAEMQVPDHQIMSGKEYMLQGNDPFIIPTVERHSLYRKEEF